MWTRRYFLHQATALAAVSASNPSFGLAFSQRSPLPPQSQRDSPEVISGSLEPLLESNVARPLRYRTDGAAFTIHNGREFFNRPLYGPNIPFRVDGGDRPEFSLYLPGHGGNLKMGVALEAGSTWLAEADSVTAQYVDGRLLYEVRDPLFGPDGRVLVEALTVGAGLWVEVRAEGFLQRCSLLWAFGGVSGRKGKRNGDIGCEIEPVSEFFQVRPEECKGNLWTLQGSRAEVQSGKSHLRLDCPEGASLRLFDAAHWDAGWAAIWQSGETGATPKLPALAGEVHLGKVPLRLRVDVLAGALLPPSAQSSSTDQDLFVQRRAELTTIAQGVCWKTPDSFLDASASALGIAADAIWDEAQGCVMHGAVAWRKPLAGWRGPYALDATGRHDRMRRHLRHWIATQNLTPVTNGSAGDVGSAGFAAIHEATGEPDKGSENTRSEALLHSNGDLSHNHYDMNLVFFDALLRHLRWTGDLSFAREAWPALVRHAAWERRLFRREYGTDGASLPLYEAYAAIWASDNLQYNGGGAAHSSAYNLFLNRRMVEIAELLGEDHRVAEAYRVEADAIDKGMRQLLWMSERGTFAEGKEWLGERALLESPAVWTVYHSIDSEVVTRKQAWQMAAERLAAIRKVPIMGEGVPVGGWQMACSDWMPYVWSLTLLVLAENLNMALALFQAGMGDEAYGLLCGSLFDAGFRGLCPGNFPMSLQLDPHRQESQRDFGDPIGCASRALVEGLWGIKPDLLRGHLDLRPQLPSTWEIAEFRHPDVTLAYRRIGKIERWEIVSTLAKPAAMRLETNALTMELPTVRVNGQTAAAAFVVDAVGSPSLLVQAPPAASWTVEIRWSGKGPVLAPAESIRCNVGEKIAWPAGVTVTSLDDPQNCLQEGRAKLAGHHTVFALIQHGSCSYWLPLTLDIAAKQKMLSTLPTRAERFEPVMMDSLLTGQVRDILTRDYVMPRSPFCSLNLPKGLLGGWANFDQTARINDAGLRRAGGELSVVDGLVFRTPADAAVPNCCYLSHWLNDQQTLQLPITGRAKAVYILLACTTFPQATRSLHGMARVRYVDGASATEVELRSPTHWWPVEQDYLVDDYIFRMEPVGSIEQPLPIRVDLQSGSVRVLRRDEFKGNGRSIPGGSATVLRVELEPDRELYQLELECRLSGVVMGVLAVTLGR